MISSIFANLLPIYFNIFLGFCAGKRLPLDMGTISALLFYVISPIMMFSGPARTAFMPYLVILPFIVLLVSGTCCLVTYRLSRKLWPDTNRNIAAMCAGGVNAGYFGLPLAMALFDQTTVAYYIVMIFGIGLYENTVAFLIMSRSSSSLREAMLRLVRLPTLYAFVLGCTCSYFSLEIPDLMEGYIHNIRGCYAILGILQIGLGLAQIQHFALDWRFIGVTFLAKFLAYPALMAAIVAIDHFLLHWLPLAAHKGLLLLAVMPLGSNSIGMAALFHMHPDKVAATVALSILLATIYIPLAVVLLLPLA